MWWLSAPDTTKLRHNVDVLVIVADQPKTESAARFPPPLNLDHPEGLVIMVFHLRFNMVSFLRIFLVWRSTFVLDKIPVSRSNDNIWCELQSFTFTGRQSVAKNNGYEKDTVECLMLLGVNSPIATMHALSLVGDLRSPPPLLTSKDY